MRRDRTFRSPHNLDRISLFYILPSDPPKEISMKKVPSVSPAVKVLRVIVLCAGLSLFGAVAAIVLDAIEAINLSNAEVNNLGFVAVCLIILVTLFGLGAKTD